MMSGAKLSISSRLKLNTGAEIPMFGLGVFQTGAGSETKEAVLAALDCGYRHIDTAKLYANEKEVGQAVRASGIPREEIFVTTKLWNSDQGYDSALRAFETSFKALNIGYIDLYLLHWPVPGRRLDSWKALTTMVKADQCRAFGVSNFTIRHLEELKQNSGVIPAVNQVEFSPYLYQKDLLDYCKANGIRLVGYAPLARGVKFREKTLVAVAKIYRKTPAQIMLRWALQHEVIVIPKSANPVRIKDNANVFDFEISAQDMATLDSLNEDFRTSWDPSTTP